jgi:ribokinase
MYPDPAPPVSRTGAGDAFASTLTTFLAEGMPLTEALARAPINSMNVVQHVGAQKGLLSRAKIEKYLAEAPEYYKVTQIG